ncbi:SRPBCC family protein [Roseovarius pelagicus]|uniref:SRPBCC family protein n=1 Tax=Roseovarius pelagicus TaxID=2980108 RepID=A0ABY6DI09_9RHOB|nr:SRPBCC family protein [Roseovarius pelagicus]UXX84598.1 SRPBCC family protein [Roseovarius pelagicus]
MKFSTREDVEAPIEFVFDQVSDFAMLERLALRRGAEVQRVDDKPQNGAGMLWNTAFELRGKRRKMQLELTEYDPPSGMCFVATSSALNCEMVLDLVALSRGRTRMSMEMELKPQTLSSRLMVQSLKLAKSNMTKRFEARAASFARDMEDKYSRCG